VLNYTEYSIVYSSVLLHIIVDTPYVLRVTSEITIKVMIGCSCGLR